MNRSEWEASVEEAMGIWSSDNDMNSPVVKKRLSLWTDRFQSRLSKDQFSRVLRRLERQCKRWPSLADIHAAVDEIEKTDEVHEGQALERGSRVQIGPMSPREYRDYATQLHHHAETVSKRPEWKEYFHRLAEFYEANGKRVEAGKPRAWPPPPTPSGQIALAPVQRKRAL